jgi:hypothetical protein
MQTDTTSTTDITTFLIVAFDQDIGQKVRELLHGTGMSLLALDVLTCAIDASRLREAVRSWRPQVLVVDSRVKLDPSDWDVPVVTFDPLSFDLLDLTEQILERKRAIPDEPIAPSRPHHGIAVGFQGIKGGVGTTTVAAGMAVAAARSEYRTAILDLSGDCALTLRANPDKEDGNLFLTEDGILVVQSVADLGQIWSILSSEYDVVVVDAGRVGENVGEARALTRLGVLFFLVVTGDEIELLQPGRYPGYRPFLNRESAGRWWQLSMAGAVPDDPDLTARVNRGEFGTSSPFLLGMGEFAARVVRGEIA